LPSRAILVGAMCAQGSLPGGRCSPSAFPRKDSNGKACRFPLKKVWTGLVGNAGSYLNQKIPVQMLRRPPAQNYTGTRPPKPIRVSMDTQKMGVYVNPSTNIRKNNIQNSFVVGFLIHLYVWNNQPQSYSVCCFS
jgi:hypothetical protein